MADNLELERDTAVAAPDAWLERRLRVFERALMGLEARQEKAQREWTRALALQEEKIAHLLAGAAAPEQAATPDEPLAQAPVAPEPMFDFAMPETSASPQVRQATAAPVTQAEMDEFLKRARQAVQQAVQQAATPRRSARKRRRRLRPLFWSALMLAALLLCAALSLAMAARQPDAAMLARPVPASGAARTMALADSGDALAQTALAISYSRRGDIASRRTALRWSRAGAAAGDPVAQYLLAGFYQRGDGVPRDAAKAFAWLEASALRGNLKAMHATAMAYAQGLGTAMAPTRAAAWFNRAAGQGFVDSQFDLAVLYERGLGVRQNPVAALKWYLIAAAAGDAQARMRAEVLEGQMGLDQAREAVQQAAAYAPIPRDAIANP